MAGRGDDHHLLEVQAVIGLVDQTALVTARLGLPSPVYRLLGVQKTVLVDRCTVLRGRLLLQGRVRTSLDLPSAGPGSGPPPTTARSHAGLPVITFTADLAFGLHIPLAAAHPGDLCQVLRAVVQDSDLQPIGPLPCRTVADRSTVLLQVKVTRTCLWEAPAQGQLRPLPGAPLPPVTVTAHPVTARPVQPAQSAHPLIASPPFRAQMPAQSQPPHAHRPPHPPPRRDIT